MDIILKFLNKAYAIFNSFERSILKYRMFKITGVNVNIIGKIYINATNITCGQNVTFYPGAYLWGYNIQIGDNVDIGINTIIYSRGGVNIGNNTVIAAQCYIIGSNHCTLSNELIRNQGMDTAPIEIGDDVWIGAQCMILKGAKIGNGAVIGANSLVNSVIPPYAIAFGTPARVHGYRKGYNPSSS